MSARGRHAEAVAAEACPYSDYAWPMSQRLASVLVVPLHSSSYREEHEQSAFSSAPSANLAALRHTLTMLIYLRLAEQR
jgi:hypothetical protein